MNTSIINPRINPISIDSVVVFVILVITFIDIIMKLKVKTNVIL